jgi:hypothetical protein
MNASSILALTLAAAATAFSASAGATVILNQSSGIATPEKFIDFAGQVEGANLSVVYASQGVTLTGLTATNGYGNGFAPTTAPAAINFGTGTAAAISFNFANAVSAASFYLVTNNGGTLISSYLNGALVESFTVGAYNGASSFQGFSNTYINSIKFTIAGDGLALIDNLAFTKAGNAVPEPGSIALLGLGLAAIALRRRQS